MINIIIILCYVFSVILSFCSLLILEILRDRNRIKKYKGEYTVEFSSYMVLPFISFIPIFNIMCIFMSILDYFSISINGMLTKIIGYGVESDKSNKVRPAMDKELVASSSTVNQ